MRIQKFSTPWKFLGFLMVIILILSACGGEDEPTTEGSNTTSNDIPSPQSSARDQNISNPIANTSTQAQVGFGTLEDTNDWLLYVEGDSLYLARFDGSEPTLISEFVHPPSVVIALGGGQVSYNAGERRRSVYMMDLETLEVNGSIRVSSQFAAMGPWSPDGQWMTLFDFPAVYVADTSATDKFRVGSIQNSAYAQFWLADSTLLTIETPNGTGVTDVRHIDLTTREEIEIDEASEQNIIFAFNNQPDLAGTVAFQETVSSELGVAVANPIVLDPETTNINVVAPPANNQGVPDRCGTFEIQEQPLDTDAEPTTLATIEESVFITNQARLDDGNILFVRWYFENCDSVTMRAALMRLDPDGSLDVITDELDPGTSPNLSFFFGETGNRVSITSDQNYVVWFGGGFSADEATLNITRLDTMETTVLKRNERTSANNSTFHLDSVFNYVSWLAG